MGDIIDTSSHLSPGTTALVAPGRVGAHTSMSAHDAWAAFAPLLAGVARVRLGVRRAGGKVAYPAAHERALTDALPSRPAAVRVYGPDGCCQALCLDFDAKGRFRGGDAERDRAIALRLFSELGLRVIVDRSPTGGFHIYIPLDFRLPMAEARDLVEAMARRFRSLDPAPHQSAASGCIRPPGSPHASGGHQELDMPPAVALWAASVPNTKDELASLQGVLEWEIRAVRQARQSAQVMDLDVDVVRIGDPSPISERLLEIARHGRWDVSRYGDDRSAARQAVITGCAAAGWLVSDVLKRIEDGSWPGLAGMYSRYGGRAAAVAAVRRDFARARAYISTTTRLDIGDSGVRNSNTSASLSRGGGDAHGAVRQWRAAVALAERAQFAGRSWYSLRFVLRALGEAAHKVGRPNAIAFGCRSLAEASGLDHSTVSVHLRTLEDLGWVCRTHRGWAEKADSYDLRIPEGLPRPTVWPRGKIHALRPAFRELGHVCALVFESIETGRSRSVVDLCETLQISRSGAYEALEMLLSWGLVSYERDGLIAHPGRLESVAEYLGATDHLYAQMLRHRRQRALWRAWLARYENDDFIEMTAAIASEPTSGVIVEIEAA